jgi:hypothetical protein
MLTTLRGAAAVAVVAVAWAALTATAATAAPTEIAVKGTQTQVNEAAGIAAMHGGMVARWYTLTFVPLYESNTLVIGTGRERFVGCLNRNGHPGCQAGDPSGTLRFLHAVSASASRAPTASAAAATAAAHATHRALLDISD